MTIKIPKEIPYFEADDREIDENASPEDIFGPDCEAKCSRKACETVEFRSMPIGAVGISNMTAFALSLPSEPDLLIAYQPKLSWQEFLAFLASILGLWFGFSLMSLTNFATASLESSKQFNIRR